MLPKDIIELSQTIREQNRDHLLKAHPDVVAAASKKYEGEIAALKKRVAELEAERAALASRGGRSRK